ncbi:hypothetical protein QMK61_14950 [Fulvimonas sp. R45]|uniref:hypothetical protein n=1 Tax=Fulvimonas sp. R45 TaxID=3045937 RepID=UPI00265E95F0|nr:hypothetical protein [Fulvimonas sp. R45]MDO1530134.1 hypothetical protein [Fulvimonas sp. R45]
MHERPARLLRGLAILAFAALAFAAVTLRLILGTGIPLQLPPLPVYIFATWACWPLNLAACELLPRRPAIRPPTLAATPHIRNMGRTS